MVRAELTADTTLLDELPLAGDILPGLPDELKAALFQAFDLQILWNKTGRQVTVWTEITEATLQALPALLNPGQDGYHDTAAAYDAAAGGAADVVDLFEAPIVHRIDRGAPIHHDPLDDATWRRTRASGQPQRDHH